MAAIIAVRNIIDLISFSQIAVRYYGAMRSRLGIIIGHVFELCLVLLKPVSGIANLTARNCYYRWMSTYKRHRFPSDIISYAVWLYYRFNISHRDIEDLLAERGITVSRESIRLWCIKFGALYARRLKRKHRGYGDTFFLDEVFVKINGKQHYLWRAVDQDGEVVDVYLQSKRDGAAAKRFFKRLLRSHGGEPRKIVADKLRSYGVAHREVIP
jgi:transposase-like protein